MLYSYKQCNKKIVKSKQFCAVSDVIPMQLLQVAAVRKNNALQQTLAVTLLAEEKNFFYKISTLRKKRKGRARAIDTPLAIEV